MLSYNDGRSSTDLSAAKIVKAKIVSMHSQRYGEFVFEKEV